MSNKTLATFRIEENDWLAFKTWAESRGSNASSELVKYALTCIGKIKTDNQLPNLDKAIDSYLDTNLDERIDKLISKRLADGIDNNLDKYVEESVAEKLDSNLDKKIDKHLDNKMDVAIASQLKTLEEKIKPLLAAEQDANKLAKDSDFINAIATEVKKS